MPQIQIDKDIDAHFLARLAGLEAAWGTEHMGDHQMFVFQTNKMDAVEQALLDYPEAYLAHRKHMKLEHLALVRREKELMGPLGLTLDDKTVARLTAAAVGLQLNPERTEIRWELSRGNFTLLPRDNVLGIALQAFEHVQSCFEYVYSKTLEIQAVALSEEVTLEIALDNLEAIDIKTGWPA